MATCPSCGEQNPDRARFCGFCGTPLAPAAAPQEVRKTVTIVFSDLKGSTNLGEALAMSMHGVDYHLRRLRECFSARNRVELVQAAFRTRSL